MSSRQIPLRQHFGAPPKVIVEHGRVLMDGGYRSNIINVTGNDATVYVNDHYSMPIPASYSAPPAVTYNVHPGANFINVPGTLEIRPGAITINLIGSPHASTQASLLSNLNLHGALQGAVRHALGTSVTQQAVSQSPYFLMSPRLAAAQPYPYGPSAGYDMAPSPSRQQLPGASPRLATAQRYNQDGYNSNAADHDNQYSHVEAPPHEQRRDPPSPTRNPPSLTRNPPSPTRETRDYATVEKRRESPSCTVEKVPAPAAEKPSSPVVAERVTTPPSSPKGKSKWTGPSGSSSPQKSQSAPVENKSKSGWNNNGPESATAAPPAAEKKPAPNTGWNTEGPKSANAAPPAAEKKPATNTGWNTDGPKSANAAPPTAKKEKVFKDNW